MIRHKDHSQEIDTGLLKRVITKQYPDVRAGNTVVFIFSVIISKHGSVIFAIEECQRESLGLIILVDASSPFDGGSCALGVCFSSTILISSSDKGLL